MVLVFLLAAVIVALYVIRAAFDVGRGRGPWVTARGFILLMILVMVPVSFDPTTFDVFTLTKFSVIVEAAIVLVGLWIIEWVWQRRPPMWRNGMQWPVLAILGWTALSTVMSSNVRISLLGFYRSYDGLFSALALGIIFFALVQTFTINDVRTALSTLYFGGGGLSVLYGLFQLHDRTFGGHWDWIDWSQTTFREGAIWSTFSNTNHFAGFMAIILPIGLVMLLLYRNWLIRALIGIITAGVLLNLVGTTSRGAWLAAVVSLVLLVALVVGIAKLNVRLVVIVVALTASTILAGFALSSTILKPQFEALFNFGGNSSVTLRLEVWESAIAMGKDKPFFGFGPDTFRMQFPRYQTDRFVDLYGPEVIVVGPHNTFLSYLATHGAPGLLAFVSVLFFAALRAVGAWRRLHYQERTRDREEADARRGRFLLAGAATGMTAYVVQASFNVQQIGLSFVFWALLALLCAIALDSGVPDSVNPARLLGQHNAAGAEGVASSKRVVSVRARSMSEKEMRPLSVTKVRRLSESQESADGVRPKVGGIVSVIVTGLTALAVGIVGWVASAPYRADHSYLAALDAHGCGRQALADCPQGLTSPVVRRHLNEAIAVNPWEGLYMHELGRLYFLDALLTLEGEGGERRALSYLGESREIYEGSLALRPDHAGMQANYARVLLKIQQISGTKKGTSKVISALRAATEANPWDSGIALLLSTVLLNDGDTEAALEVLRRSLTYSPEDPELLRKAAELYRQQGQRDNARELRAKLRGVGGKENSRD